MESTKRRTAGALYGLKVHGLFRVSRRIIADELSQKYYWTI